MNRAARQLIESSKNPNVDTFRRMKNIENDNGEVAPLPVHYKFQLIPDLDSDVPSALSTLIRKAGGKPCYYDDDDYALRIIDLWSLEKNPQLDFSVPHDTYSSWFIYHSIQYHKNNLPPPDPKKYLITPSIYASYEPVELLMKNVKWSELDALEVPKFYSAKTLMEKLKPKVSSPVAQPPVERQALSNDDEISVVLNDMNETENGSPDAAAVESVDVCLNVGPSNEREEMNPPNETVSGSLASSIQQSVTSIRKSNNLKRKTGTAPEDVSKESSNGSPSKAGARLTLSPENPNPVAVAVKRPRLVPKAVAGPSTKSSGRKKFKGNQYVSVATKDDQWVDCGTQESAIEDFSFDDDNHSDVSELSYRSEPGSGASDSSKRDHNSKVIKKIPYTEKDDKRIVRMIFDQNVILYTKGSKLWKALAKSHEFKGKRSWASLNNRWRKNIVPTILRGNKKGKSNAYNVSDEELKQIKQLQRIPHRPGKVCPDVVF